MAGPAYEIERSYEVYRYLSEFPVDAQNFLRRQMRFVLKRDRIVTELQMQDLVRHKAEQFEREFYVGRRDAAAWDALLFEAKKQLTDLYFGANYSLDYLKYIVAENAQDLETAFEVRIPNLLNFSLNLEKADINILIKKMYQYEALSPDEKARLALEIHELRIVLIQRLISSQPEFVRVAHKFLSISDLHGIFDRIVGSGRVGGKSAGMLLAYRILVTPEEGDPFDFSRWFKIPNSYYVGDDVFHSFLDYNGWLWLRNQKFKTLTEIEDEYQGIREQIVRGHFPVAVWERLRQTVRSLGNKPLIVRSSSLLEDNFGLSFAGKYDSFFLPNQGTLEENLEALGDAVRKVYAGVFSPDAMAYRKSNEIIYRYESMAILIQEVEGRRYGRYFLPDMAGVIFSENPYCWSRRIRKQDGMLRLVHGLGTRAVERVGEDHPRMVALGQPTLRPEADAALERYLQKLVDVIDLEQNAVRTIPVEALVEQGIAPGQAFIMSVRKERHLQEAFTTVDLRPGNAAVTFDRLLARTQFPRVLRAAVEKIRRHYGIELDLEMAGEIAANGAFSITLLQCRPQSLRPEQQPQEIPDVPEEDVLFSCRKEVPNGRIEGARWVVYVSPAAYARLASPHQRYEVARIVGRINQGMAKGTAILLGPGRWGTTNTQLGVPVRYYEINHFALLGEVAHRTNGSVPEVSFGTHFFQDLAEAGIVCIPIYPDAEGVVFNEHLLLEAPNELGRFVSAEQAEAFGEVVRVVHLDGDRVLQVRLNGREERGICYLERIAAEGDAAE